MTAKIIDGKAIANQLKEDIASSVHQRHRHDLSQPGLAVLLIGNDPASISYVQHKQRGCQEVGIFSQLYHLSEDTASPEIIKLIDDLNHDPKIHGILLQLPLPKHLHVDEFVELIHIQKDVDGIHPYNLGRLAQRRPLLRPCTPYGIMKLLQSLNEENLVGKHAVVVGASNIVGRPMALELLLGKITVTVCHRFTVDLKKHVESADILISAMGKPNVIQSDWIKKDSIVIDAGFCRSSDHQICGDIDFVRASKRAKWITPVPGGVGPMTVAMLLHNTVFCANLLEKYKVVP